MAARKRWPWVFLLLWGAWGTVGSAPAGGGPAPSVIELPMRVSLAPLFRQVEQKVPLQSGDWRHWRQWHGIQVRYQAWRGRLSQRLQGDTLLLQAHVRYRVQARTSLLGTLDIEGSCGIGAEPPRQAVIGVLVKLQWLPDWTLRPLFKVLPTRFLDRCEMTAAGVDVTPLVEEAFRDQLRSGLRQALPALSTEIGQLRRQAARVWAALQEPVELQPGNWLLVRPVAVAATPLQGQGDTLALRLALTFYPMLVSGERPLAAVQPLPPLQQYWPAGTGAHFSLSMTLDYGAIGRQIGAALAGRRFELGELRVTVTSVQVHGKGQELTARIGLGGEVAGSVEVWAGLRFSKQQGRLELANLEYVADLEDPALANLSDLFYERIRDAIQAAANRLLQQQLQRWRTLLAGRLQGLLGDGWKVDLSSLALRSVQVQMDTDGIRLEGNADGAMVIETVGGGTGPGHSASRATGKALRARSGGHHPGRVAAIGSAGINSRYVLRLPPVPDPLG